MPRWLCAGTSFSATPLRRDSPSCGRVSPSSSRIVPPTGLSHVRRWRFVVLGIGLVVALTACGSPRSLVLTSHVSVNGEQFDGGPATSYRISDSDIQPIGPADDINAEVNGSTAYKLNGVDPSRVVVMPSRDTSEAAYWIFFREGALPSPAGSDLDWSFPGIPGLCQYVIDPPSGCN